MAKSKSKTKKVACQFEIAIDNTPDVMGGFQPGLKALSSNSSLIEVADTRLIDGSLDIDKKVQALYPNDNRWDYAISYNSKVCFVEVHPAETSQVTIMINKYNWLKSWLSNCAPDIYSLKKYEPSYVWVASGRNGLLRTSKEYRKLSVSGIHGPISKLKLTT